MDEKFHDQLGEVNSSVDSTATVQLTSYEANRLAYDVQSEKGGVVVFSEIYYPGWTCTVDGQDVPISRADYVLRAIRVEPGRHTVVMSFDPQTVHTTETIAYVALVILLLLLVAFGMRNFWHRQDAKNE